MGRGRQKAKQTKVARELKYFTPATDYRALEKELKTGGGIVTHATPDVAVDDEDDELDEWSDEDDADEEDDR
jgi:hypothetical protein